MPLYLIVVLISILLGPTIQQNNNSSEICYLNKNIPQAPKPSLLQCYFYNSNSCCLSVHDDIIKDQMSAIFTDSCSKKYPAFLALMCYGCHPNEFKYTNHTTKKLLLCDTFVDKLWGSRNFEQPSTVFDRCGFKADPFSSPYKDDTTKFIIPGKTFPNVTAFLNSFTVPFFNGYTVQIVKTNCDDDDDSCDSAIPCYKGSSSRVSVPYILLFVLIIGYLIY